MGNGNVDVGDKTATKPGRPIIERLAATAAASVPRIEAPQTIKEKRPGNCAAMSQQGGDNVNLSAPQKFVQLVGCREPKARPGPWVRPGPPKR